MQKIIETGLTWLSDIPTLPTEIEACRKTLMDLAQKPLSKHDVFSWLSVIQSLSALSKKTFGVGAIIVDSHDEIVAAGHNQVFNPYFRSDLHAEMVVLNQLENNRKSDTPPIHYTLYTSLEPCMMCLARSIFSRIGHLYFVVKDPHGGVLEMKHVPFKLAELMGQQNILEAPCITILKDISTQIHNFSVPPCLERLALT